MGRKKSIQTAASDFLQKADEIKDFCQTARKGQTKKHVSWIYDYAIIRLYREFESLMFDALVGAINNDTSTISETTGHDFPDHLKEEVCQFLVVGTGYEITRECPARKRGDESCGLTGLDDRSILAGD